MRKLLYIILAILLLAACQQDEPVFEQADNTPITVKLNIGQKLSGTTRASNAMGPEKENLIYDIWLLQYNSYGELTSATGVDNRQHLRVDEPGVMEVIDFQVTLRALDDCTVVLVGNLGDTPLDNNASWPDNLKAFRKLTIPIDYMSVSSGDAKDGHVNKIGLFGYYKGAVKDNMTLNVVLGRLITRLRLNIKPSHAMTGPVVLKLENVRSRINIFPTDTPYQPKGTTDEEKAADRAANFTSFTKTLSGLGVEGIVQYFYTGENISPSATDATKLIVTHNDKNYTILLGAESPEASEPSSRNLSLERNSGYNFGIKLRAPTWMEHTYDRTGWEAKGDQGVNNASNIIRSDNYSTSIWKTSLGTYIDINMSKKLKFNVIKLTQPYSSPDNRVGTMIVQGSHNGTNFENINTLDLTNNRSTVLESFTLPETVEYQHVRIIFNSWVNSVSNNVSVYLSQFYVAYNRYEY